jgi:hypothetical protein
MGNCWAKTRTVTTWLSERKLIRASDSRSGVKCVQLRSTSINYKTERQRRAIGKRVRNATSEFT